MGHRVGIDLGTTNSAIAFTELGRQRCVKVDRNEFTSAIFPSAIAADRSGKFVFGGAAARDPNRVRQFKRGIGTEQLFELGGKPYRALELSAALLGEIKRKFEEQEGPIDGAVITVPANYGEAKRSEVREAGRLAGLNVLCIINEPSAAAIAYARSDKPPGENTLVIDWGGGTLDVSLLDATGDELDIKANEGDERCGGMDVDRALRDVLLERFAGQLGAGVADRAVRNEVEAWAEKIKMHLSEEPEWNDVIALKTRGLFLELRYTRAELERLLAPLVDRVFAAVDRCLQRAPEGALAAGDVKDVLLVGGSCRIPLLQRRVVERFGRKGRASLDPMEVVALGAAYQAQHHDEAGEVVAIHSTSRHLGVGCCGLDAKGLMRNNLFDVLLPATTKLPAEATHEYWTVHDDQELIQVSVFESLHDADTVDGLELLAQRDFRVPRGPARSFTVHLTFRYDVEQQLTVTVSVPERGTRDEWVPARRARLEAEREATQARVDEIAAGSLSALTEYRARVVGRLEGNAERPAVRTLLAELDRALEAGDVAEARRIKGRIAAALFEDGLPLN